MQPGDCCSMLRLGRRFGVRGGNRGAFMMLDTSSRSVYSVLFKLHENFTREGGGDCYSHLRAAEW